MKKFVLVSLMTVGGFGLKAQTLYVQNYSPCDVRVLAQASPTAPLICLGGMQTAFYVLPAGMTSPLVLGATDLTPSPSGPWIWNVAKIQDANPFSMSCPPDPGYPNIIYTDAYHGTTQCPMWSGSSSRQVQIYNNCNTCPVGTIVRVTWTDLPGGDAQFDIN